MKQLLFKALILTLQVFLTLLKLRYLASQLCYFIVECILIELTLVEYLVNSFTSLHRYVFSRRSSLLLLHSAYRIVKHLLHIPVLLLFILEL